MRQRSFYFSDGQYLQLLQRLCQDLTKPEAFVQLMGIAKTGKSALCETLTLYLLRKGYDVVYIDYPIESPEMLRNVLVQKFNLPTTNNVARQLEDTFLKGFEKPKLLVFDDSHQLSDITLLEIHRMAEIQAGSKRVLNVLLCGEPELDERLLNKKELKSLLLNVSQKYLLQPMDKKTLSQFFFSYIAQTDSVGLQLSEDALVLLYRSSKGYPGPATLLVELISQSNGDSIGQQVITKLELAEQIKSSDIQKILPVAELFNVNQLGVLGPIAAVFTIAAVGFMFQIFNGVAPHNQGSLQLSDSESPFSGSTTSTFTSRNLISDNNATEADSILDSTQNTSQIVSQERTPVQLMPSLLRPTSVFSLDDEEVISDFVLVTAAEIGLAADIIIDPEFVSEQRATASIQLGPENLSQNSLRSDMRLSESDLSLNAPPVTKEVEQAKVRAENGVAQRTDQEIDHPLAIPLAEQLVKQFEESLLKVAISPSEALQNRVLDEEAAAAVP